MSISSAKSGGTGISLALDNNFMEPIASTVVGSGGVNSVIFNDIPQTYKHLQIRILSRDVRSGVSVNSVFTNLNGDFGTNYSQHGLYGSGSAAFATGSASQNYGVLHQEASGSAAANVFGAGIIDILDYTNTNKYTTMRGLTGYDDNSAGRVALWSSLWVDTSAVTSIMFTNSTNVNFSQYSRFSLYGIKG
jgi:hypothetical protein